MKTRRPRDLVSRILRQTFPPDVRRHVTKMATTALYGRSPEARTRAMNEVLNYVHDYVTDDSIPVHCTTDEAAIAVCIAAAQAAESKRREHQPLFPDLLPPATP